MFHCPYLAALLKQDPLLQKNYYCVAENKFLTNAQANYLCQTKHSDFSVCPVYRARRSPKRLEPFAHAFKV